MTTAPGTEVKPLVFQQDRGPLSQDKLYADMGYRFIIAPNRYRKLAGKTPYEITGEKYMTLKLECALNQHPEISDIRELYETACAMDVPEPVYSSGLRMFGLTTDEQKLMQEQAIAMMKSDWPEYADYVVGYEPHINMFDEILIWRNK